MKGVNQNQVFSIVSGLLKTLIMFKVKKKKNNKHWSQSTLKRQPLEQTAKAQQHSTINSSGTLHKVSRNIILSL